MLRADTKKLINISLQELEVSIAKLTDTRAYQGLLQCVINAGTLGGDFEFDGIGSAHSTHSFPIYPVLETPPAACFNVAAGASYLAAKGSPE